MKRLKTILAICAALGWWGAIYPQFTLVKGTYEIVWENDGGEPGTVEKTVDAAAQKARGGEIYWEILRADREQIRFKSRLLTELQNFAETFAGAKEKDG